MNLYLLDENQNWKLFENLTPDSPELKERNITISADSKFYGDCYIGNNSIVNNSTVENSTVYSNSRVYNNSTVENSTVDNSRVYNNSTVENSTVDNSRVYNNSTVENSRVYNSTVGNYSTVENSTIQEAQLDSYTPISIIGSRGLVSRLNTYPDGHIQIGCLKKTGEEWLRTYKEVGKEYNFSEKEIKEYKDYIDLLIKRMQK